MRSTSPSASSSSTTRLRAANAVHAAQFGRDFGKGLCRVIARAVRVGAAEYPRVAVEDVDQRQVVPFADFVVVEVMSRGDLDAARAELQVHIVVGDDRDQATGQRQADLFADQSR